MQVQKYKKTELGEIPEEWEIVRLSQTLLTLESGSRDKGGSTSHGVPSIGGEHISKDGKLILKNMRYVPEKFFGLMKRGIINKNDVLLVKDGATIGKTAIVKEIPFEKGVTKDLRGDNH